MLKSRRSHAKHTTPTKPQSKNRKAQTDKTYFQKKSFSSRSSQHGLSRPQYGAIYQPGYISTADRTLLLQELKQFSPIWEMRFSKSNPPPDGQENRSLLRPVYWLGSWQFACLNYYHPPKGTTHRCVQSDPFPTTMQRIVHEVEKMVHAQYEEKDIPRGWHLNTCLINYYGSVFQNKWNDVARVGEHRDYEPGPVASISFGERALFQFVKTEGKNSPSQVALNQWLEDSSLQIFGGDKYKKFLFHRVQRVEKNKMPNNSGIALDIPNFQTRRLNLTFRYVPLEHIYDLQDMPKHIQEDILPYVEKLAEKSDFWRKSLG